MTRAVIVAAALALGWPMLRHSTVAGEQQTAFRSRVDVVSVNVSVMSGRMPVTGLTATDFDLTDNGVRQSVDAASLERVPIDVTLVLTGRPPGRESAVNHLRGLLSADATRALLTPEDRLRVVEVGSDVRGGLVGADFSVPNQYALRTQGLGVALADGLFYALAWPVDPDRRHLVVAFTDGWDTWSTLEIETLPKLAARSDAVLHAVFWATPAADGPGDGGRIAGGGILFGGATARVHKEAEASVRQLETAIEQTGGTLQRVSQAPQALAAIIADFRSSYVLRYTPRGVALAGWHDLKVSVTRPGSFRIRARRGYEGG